MNACPPSEIEITKIYEGRKIRIRVVALFPANVFQRHWIFAKRLLNMLTGLEAEVSFTGLEAELMMKILAGIAVQPRAVNNNAAKEEFNLTLSPANASL